MTDLTADQVSEIYDLGQFLALHPEHSTKLLSKLMGGFPSLVLQAANAMGYIQHSVTFKHSSLEGVEFNVSDHQKTKIMQMARGGTPGVTSGKVEAIKELRNITGCGLKEAKDAVEAWLMVDQLGR